MRHKVNKKLLLQYQQLLDCQAQNVPVPVKPVSMLNMDKDVKASNDFFRYVNGTWLDTEIQATERGGVALTS
jgi:predicted metalloendopeptidase